MLELQVAGMTCGHCVRAVTQAIRSLDPGAQVQVDLAGRRVRVEAKSTVDQLINALGAAGYPAVVAQQATPAAPARRSCCGCA
jgi:copper chaperone